MVRGVDPGGGGQSPSPNENIGGGGILTTWKINNMTFVMQE